MGIRKILKSNLIHINIVSKGIKHRGRTHQSTECPELYLIENETIE